METILLVQEDGSFKKKGLPREVQYSTVKAALAKDVDSDGLTDIILGGNFFGYHVILGNADAQALSYLKALPNGEYTFVSLTNQSNLLASYRKLAIIHVGNTEYLIAVRNNGTPDVIAMDAILLVEEQNQ